MCINNNENKIPFFFIEENRILNETSLQQIIINEFSRFKINPSSLKRIEGCGLYKPYRNTKQSDTACPEWKRHHRMRTNRHRQNRRICLTYTAIVTNKIRFRQGWDKILNTGSHTRISHPNR